MQDIKIQLISIFMAGLAAPAGLAAATTPLYGNAPGHPWDQLHAALFIRTFPAGNRFGENELEPLLWHEALLEQPAWPTKLAILDSFLEANTDRLIKEPLKRAFLQHDLWGLHDWLTKQRGSTRNDAIRHRAREMQRRVSALIRRLALPRQTIATLPDTVTDTIAARRFPEAFDPQQPQKPFLPPGLLAADGPWVCLGDYAADNQPLARQHMDMTDGRSAFLIFVRFPGGRSAARVYLDNWPRSDRQIPEGTQTALVRRMLLIDTNGRIRETPITEAVQFVVIRRLQDALDPSPKTPPAFSILRTGRRRLFQDPTAGLRTVGPNETGFSFGPQLQLRNPHEEPRGSLFRNGPPHRPLHTCIVCHRGPGVESMLSLSDLGASVGYLRGHGIAITSMAKELAGAIRWKSQRYDWGLLEGLMDRP